MFRANRDGRGHPGERRAGCPHPAGPCGSACSTFEITKVRRAKSPALQGNRKRQPKGKRAFFDTPKREGALMGSLPFVCVLGRQPVTAYISVIMAMPMRMLIELIWAARVPSPPALRVSSGATLATGPSAARRAPGGYRRPAAAASTPGGQRQHHAVAQRKEARHFAKVFFAEVDLEQNADAEHGQEGVGVAVTSARRSSGAGRRMCSAASASMMR